MPSEFIDFTKVDWSKLLQKKCHSFQKIDWSKLVDIDKKPEVPEAQVQETCEQIPEKKKRKPRDIFTAYRESQK